MINDLLILLFLSIASFIGGLLGFGDALIFIPLAACIIDINSAIVLSVFWTNLMLILNFFKYRKYVDYKFIYWNLLLGIPGTILGSILLFVVSTRWIQLFFGCYLLYYCIDSLSKYILKKMRSQQKESSSLGIGWQLFGGFSFGFLGGLIGAAGPINLILLKRTKHDLKSFIGTFALSAFVMNIFKMGIYFYNNMFPSHLMVIFIIGFIFIYISTVLGQTFTKYIPKELFEIIVLFLLLVVGLKFIWQAAPWMGF